MRLHAKALRLCRHRRCLRCALRPQAVVYNERHGRLRLKTLRNDLGGAARPALAAAAGRGTIHSAAGPSAPLGGSSCHPLACDADEVER